MRLGLMLSVVLTLGLAGTATAAPPLGPDGETEAIYDYTAAIRQRVLIPQPGIDQDANGAPDKITIDIIRPSGATEVPVIIDPSPYFTTLCRGQRSECMGDMDGDGVNDHWPLFFDNYFVPRGYAVILRADERHRIHQRGLPDAPAARVTSPARSRSSTGSTAGATGVDKDGNAVVADWDNGKAGDDRQVLRRDAGERRRGDRRRPA